MNRRDPPAFVPTLTDVVAPALQAPQPVADALQADALVHRVLQRVDVRLQRRLREAIATVVLEQTDALLPVLREQIELTVRQTVLQALADELDASPPA